MVVLFNDYIVSFDWTLPLKTGIDFGLRADQIQKIANSHRGERPEAEISTVQNCAMSSTHCVNVWQGQG
jgi:hypothetical protein